MHRTTLGLAALGFLGGLLAWGCGDSGRGSDFDPAGEGASSSSGSADDDDDTGGASGSIGASGGTSGGGASSSSSGSGPACATASATTTRQPIYLDIILDGSGSMDGYANVTSSQQSQCVPGTYYDNPGNIDLCKYKSATEADPLVSGRLTGKKWLAARGALKAYFDAKGAAASDQLGVGMLFFYGTDSQFGQEQHYANVPIALLDGTQAAALWDPIKPNRFPLGGTPIYPSVMQSTQTLQQFTPSGALAAEGRRAILLITDGVPTPETGSQSDVEGAVTAALAGTPSVATAVIGVGNPTDDVSIFDPTFLSRLASKGGVAAPGCDPAWANGSAPGTSCHLQVTPGEKTAEQLQQEIGAAIDSIAGSLASCELTLDKTADIDPTKVNVLYVDGAGTSSQVPQDDANGWSYDDPTNPTKVILHGQSCDTLKADPNGKVDIVIGCPTGTSVVH